VHRRERGQSTNTREGISCGVFTTRFVANVKGHVTQLKPPTEIFGVFDFASITLIEHERYSFVVSDQSKESTIQKITYSD